MTDKDRIAALEREVAALKAAQSPPKNDFVPMTDEQHRDWVHQMSERRMSMATPPSVIRDWNVIPDHIVRGVVQDRRAPTGPSGAGASGQVTKISTNPGLPGSGWSAPVPLSNPPGINWVDAQCIADEVRQRAELARKLGKG